MLLLVENKLLVVDENRPALLLEVNSPVLLLANSPELLLDANSPVPLLLYEVFLNKPEKRLLVFSYLMITKKILFLLVLSLFVILIFLLCIYFTFIW
jgi:hypothetical protein